MTEVSSARALSQPADWIRISMCVCALSVLFILRATRVDHDNYWFIIHGRFPSPSNNLSQSHANLTNRPVQNAVLLLCFATHRAKTEGCRI